MTPLAALVVRIRTRLIISSRASFSSAATPSCSPLPTVAVVGRPNAGKSTLFNRLAGRRLALVHERPGMTRDRIETRASLFDLQFRLVDTPGLDDGGCDGTSHLDRDMLVQSQLAVEHADVVLFLFDAREGITSDDEYFARWLRKHLGRHSHSAPIRPALPVVLVANKCEGHVPETTLMEAERLGFGRPIPISAAHGDGRLGLFEALNRALQQTSSDVVAETDTAFSGDRLRLAVVGRQNVGKSTLVNGLLRDPNRCLTGPKPGLTRDSISTELQHDGHVFELVDTAGITGTTPMSWSQHDPMDALGMDQSVRSMRFANVVGLVLDAAQLATSSPTLQLPRRETAIAKHVIDNGRCLIIIANKWDQVPPHLQSGLRKRLQDAVANAVPQAAGVVVVPVSALNGTNIDSVLRSSLDVHDRWNRRISTGLLNRWLAEWLRTATLPLGQGGRRLKARYMTQVKARPPTFCVFGSRGLDQHENFVRDLSAALRREFDLEGVPVRILCRAPENPFAPASTVRAVPSKRRQSA